MGQMFDTLSKSQKPQNPMQMLQGLKQDPIGFMRKMGFNIPQGIDPHNPQSIISALMQSGQVSRNAYTQGMGMMAQFPGPGKR